MTFYRCAGAIIACIAALSFGSAYGAEKSTKKAAAAACTPAAGAAVSGLPLPKACTAAQPAATGAGNVTVLDWAGFKGAVSYTFDDNSPTQILHYNELNAPGIRMTFFTDSSQVLLTDPDGNSMLPQWKQVVTDGHELANHTVQHCQIDANGALTNCAFPDPALSSNTPSDEVAQADTFIKDVLEQKDSQGNKAVWTMASPFGDHGWAAFAIAKNYIAQRDVWIDKVNSFLPPADLAKVYNLPCFAGNGLSGGWGVDGKQSTYEQITDDARGRHRWAIFLFHGVSPKYAQNDPQQRDWHSSACCPVDVNAIVGSMNHLKAWGDVWGDAIVNIAAYNIGQKMFKDLTPTVNGNTTTWTWTLPTSFPPGKYLRVTVDGGTLSQNNVPLVWNDHGFYEVSLSAGKLTLVH